MNPLSIIEKYEVILASKSPRRHQLLEGLGVSYAVELREVEEIFPETIDAHMVPEYLSELKASAFSQSEMNNKQLIITADTIVLLKGEVIGKPTNHKEAVDMLNSIIKQYNRWTPESSLRDIIS